MGKFTNAGPWICFKEKGSMIRKMIIVITAMINLACSTPTGQPNPITVVTKIKGQKAILRCNVDGIIPWFVAWRKDGRPVSELGSNVRSKKSSGNLNILIDSEADEGTYTCYPRKGPKFKPYSVFLSISLVPEVSVVSLNPVKPMEGGEITINCSASGKPRPSFEWFSSQEIRLLPRINRPRRRMTVTEWYTDDRTIHTSLVLSPVVPEDRGHFKCIATNNISSTRDEVYIDVQFAPKMLTSQDAKDVYWWEGRRANLSCQAQGNPAPVIVWSPNSVISPLVTVTEGIIVTSTLWFSEKAIFEDISSFQCHAENIYGETESRHFSIEQVYPPLTPVITVNSVKDDEMELSINVPRRMATPTPTYVKADYYRLNSTRLMNAGTAFHGDGTLMTLYGIMLGHSYYIKVKVFNRVGYSNETTLEIIAEKYSIYDTTTFSSTQTHHGHPNNQDKGSSNNNDKNNYNNNDTNDNNDNMNNELDTNSDEDQDIDNTRDANLAAFRDNAYCVTYFPWLIFLMNVIVLLFPFTNVRQGT